MNLRVAEVIIQESESLENALRRFKRKVQQEDIIKEIKKHSFYMKPGEKRRAKEALSRKRLRDPARFPQAIGMPIPFGSLCKGPVPCPRFGQGDSSNGIPRSGFEMFGM